MWSTFKKNSLLLNQILLMELANSLRERVNKVASTASLTGFFVI